MTCATCGGFGDVYDGYWMLVPCDECYRSGRLSLNKCDDFLKSLNDYTDCDGLVHPKINPVSGETQNGIRWSTEAYLLARRRGCLSDELRSRAIVAILSCEFAGIPGLFHRSPGRLGDQEGPDDYFALGAFCKEMETPEIAKRIIQHGQKVFYVRDIDVTGREDDPLLKWYLIAKKYFGWIKLRYNYNNQDPSKITPSSWLGRMPHLIGHLKLAAGLSPNLIERLLIMVTILFSMLRPKNDHDSKSLCWFLNRTAFGSGFFTTLLVTVWYVKLYKDYKEGMKEVLSGFFSNSEYVTVKYWIE